MCANCGHSAETVIASFPVPARCAGGRAGQRTRRSAMRQRHDSVQSAASMHNEHEQRLRSYADLTVRVGLHLQPHQRLLIIGPLATGGASLEAAPLVRHITAAAYAAGAR